MPETPHGCKRKVVFHTSATGPRNSQSDTFRNRSLVNNYNTHLLNVANYDMSPIIRNSPVGLGGLVEGWLRNLGSYRFVFFTVG